MVAVKPWPEAAQDRCDGRATAPGERPPCIQQGLFGIAGDWHRPSPLRAVSRGTRHPVSASTCWYPRGRASVITAFFVHRTLSRANSLGLWFGLESPFKLPFFRE